MEEDRTPERNKENRKTIEKSIGLMCWLYEMINKIDKSITRLRESKESFSKNQK